MTNWPSGSCAGRVAAWPAGPAGLGLLFKMGRCKNKWSSRRLLAPNNSSALAAAQSARPADHLMNADRKWARVPSAGRLRAESSRTGGGRRWKCRPRTGSEAQTMRRLTCASGVPVVGGVVVVGGWLN